MKVFVFQGGLGNQIFQYAYYKAMLQSNPHLRCLYPMAKSHNGFELSRWFDVTLNDASFFQKAMYEIARRLQGKSLMGRIKMIADKDVDIADDKYFAVGYIQTQRFLQDDFIRFKDLELSTENRAYCRLLETTDSIAIHVRRGDYLQEPYRDIYGGICTDEYYRKALDIVKSKYPNATYFVFSNDAEWVKANLTLDNAHYVDCNTGVNSPMDMFLMSKAKALILANSTFSYWGAKLNNRGPLVIYPKKWINKPYEVPDIFAAEWIGI